MMTRMTVIGLVMLALLPASVAAQDTPQTIALLKAGWLRAYANEVALDTSPAFHDPVKFRGGAWWPDSYLVIVSGDLLSGDPARPRRDERGFFGIRHDDDFAKSVNAQEFVINLTDPNCSGEDSCQRTRLRLTTRYLELLGRRIDVATASPAPVDHLASGLAWRFYVQGDGNLVLYEIVQGTYCPRWAITWLPHTGTGYIDRTGLSPPCN